MDNYLVFKMIHILSSMILIGTGAGIAFFMLMGSRSNNPQGLVVITRTVVVADWVFTAPAVIIQLVSGLVLMQLLGYSFSSLWFISVFSLFILIGACWLPVVWIQYRLRSLAKKIDLASDGSESSARYNKEFRNWMRIWMLLGLSAFTAIIFILYLMVFKPISVI